MAGPLTCSNWGSFPAGREKCSAGACPQPQAGQRPTLVPSHRREDRPTGAPIFILWCAGGNRQPAWAIGTKMNSDWYENVIPAPAGDTNHRHLNNDCPGSQEECSAGSCPQLGVGCVAQTTPDPSINQCTQFSYLGVPATAGMTDWYESMSRTPIRDEFRRRPATPTTVT